MRTFESMITIDEHAVIVQEEDKFMHNEDFNAMDQGTEARLTTSSDRG